MGGREDPALMMDPANCSPVQVAGTCQKKSLPITACPDGSCMSAHKDRTGDVIPPCSRAGLLIWLLACAPLSSWDVRGWIDVRLGNSQGGQSAAATPRRAREQSPTQMFHPSLARWRMALWYPSHGPRDCWQESRLGVQDKSDVHHA